MLVSQGGFLRKMPSSLIPFLANMASVGGSVVQAGKRRVGKVSLHGKCLAERNLIIYNRSRSGQSRFALYQHRRKGGSSMAARLLSIHYFIASLITVTGALVTISTFLVPVLL